MKPSTLIQEAYTNFDTQKDIRADISDVTADAMYLKSKDMPTMYERVGKKTPSSKNVKHNLKTIRDIRTSNTVTKNKGLIRDDIDPKSIYKSIVLELQSFPNSLAQKISSRPSLRQISSRNKAKPQHQLQPSKIKTIIVFREYNEI